MKTTLIIIGSFVLVVGLVFLLGFTNVFYTKTVGKAQQNADRQVFEQTQSYVEGKREELAKYHHEWMKSDAEGKKAVESTIRISFANFDENKITDSDLFSFLHQIMHN